MAGTELQGRREEARDRTSAGDSSVAGCRGYLRPHCSLVPEVPETHPNSFSFLACYLEFPFVTTTLDPK